MRRNARVLRPQKVERKLHWLSRPVLSLRVLSLRLLSPLHLRLVAAKRLPEMMASMICLDCYLLQSLQCRFPKSRRKSELTIVVLHFHLDKWLQGPKWLCPWIQISNQSDFLVFHVGR